MKTAFTAKYLQHLAKKNGDKGFTLIELLVVIIIVGVLAAIALPSFLNQIGKARGSEAKSSLGTINRSQQAYRLENNTMASGLTLLDAKISGKFYTYQVAPSAGTLAQNNATATTGVLQSDLKGYAALVSQSGDNFQQTICESNDVVTSISNASTFTASIGAPTAFGTCANTATQKVID